MAVIGIWRNVNNNQKTTIVGDGNQRRDFTHVVDIVVHYKVGVGKETHQDAWELGTALITQSTKCTKCF